MKVIIFDLWSTIAYHKYKDGSLGDICKECYKKDYRTFLKSYEDIFQTSKNVSFDKGFEKLFKKLKINMMIKRLKNILIKGEDMNLHLFFINIYFLY